MEKRVHFGSSRLLFCFIIITRLFLSQLWGLDPEKRLDRYLVDNWQVSAGIPSNTVYAITQAPDGYLWIATSKGLVRFDGLEFKMAQIPPLETRTLFVDRAGTLWIGTSAGLTSYRYQTGRFKAYTGADGISEDGIRRIKEDIKGNLWISFTSSYVNRLGNGQFTPFAAAHGLLGKKINAIVEDRSGSLLFGSRENGVFAFRDGKFFTYPIPGLENLFIIAMYEDSKGELWIGTSSGLFRVRGKRTERYTVKDGLADGYITCITQDSEQNLWVGTPKGLHRIKKKADGSLTFENMLASLPINCLFEDREKSLWLGTDNSGIKRLKDGKFTPYAALETRDDANPLALFEDRRGSTWIGSADGELFRCRAGNLIESLNPAPLSGTGIAAIAEDAAGNLWLGTIGKGVFQKKGRTFSQLTDRHGLADNLVTSITRDSRHDLWFATFDGVSVLRQKKGTIESLKTGNGLSGKVVHNVYEDSTHNIWIGADKGITVLEKGKIAKENMAHWLPGISVACIHEDLSRADSEGPIYWIATYGAGLKRLRPKDAAVSSFTTSQGMTSNNLYQFLEDQQGSFWIMSDSGILRVAKSELNRFAEGGLNGAEKINCTSFGTADGLKSLEFDNAFSRNSALKTADGQFLFVTRKGIAVVNPDTVRIDKTAPPVVIEAVLFDHQPIPRHRFTDAAAPAYKGITNLVFKFTAPTFLSPEKVRFKYRLQGFDKEWLFLSAGDERIARYQDLAPGSYTFRVTACSAEGVWNQTGAAVTFTLKPLFYQTLLFKIALFFIFGTLLAAAFYIYKKRPFKKRAKYKYSPLEPIFAEECVKKLMHLMEVDKVYCDADLSLHSLAEKLSISPHLLSQILNEKLNKSFADFINSFRVEEAKRILGSPRGAKKKMTAVAIEAGFNTMAAFYMVFKKYTNKTPAQYKKEIADHE